MQMSLGAKSIKVTARRNNPHSHLGLQLANPRIRAQYSAIHMHLFIYTPMCKHVSASDKCNKYLRKSKYKLIKK